MTAQAPERDRHTIGPLRKLRRMSAFGEGGSAALVFEQTEGSPALGETQQAELRAAVQEPSAMSGIGLPN